MIGWTNVGVRGFGLALLVVGLAVWFVQQPGGQAQAPGTLMITVTDDPDPVALGGKIKYAITVENTGSEAETGVVIEDELSGAGTIQSAVPSQGSCDVVTTKLVNCELGTIAAGGTATIQLVAQAASVKQPDPGDTDGDGCSDERENGPDETLGGQRNWVDPWDYYDVLGPGAVLPKDGVIDLPNDILGVILHFAPSGAAPYDVNFDRGPQIGANVWNMSAPDGVIDLPNDILGVILQFNHSCQ